MPNNFANSISSNIGASNSGATNTLTITNPSNTASSNAQENITVGGTSAGDPFTTYTVAGTTNWSVGIDNSVSGDPYVIAASTALGTTNTLVIDTLGNSTFNAATSTNPLLVWARNSDTNAASLSTVQATVVVGSAADPLLQVAVEATSNYCLGIDNSDSDKLKINFDSASVTPSTGTNLLTITSSGEITKPLQPAFLAYLGSSVANATGNGTSYTLGDGTALTEVFDQGGDFNTNGTFTAPVTGRYQLSFQVTFADLGATATSGYVLLATSNRNYYFGNLSVGAARSSGNFYAIAGSVLADMDANDTAVVSAVVTGVGADSVDILGTDTNSFFSGYLAC